jgi:DNA polymerase I-like protein with 3'-5' exonuclease and polymerase domains
LLAVSKTPLGKKYPLVHTVHDELIYIVKDEDAQEMLDTVQEIMRSGVSWWKELITWSEGDIAQTYGAAK